MLSDWFGDCIGFVLNFIVKIGIPCHLFHLGLEIFSGCGRLGLNSPFISQETISFWDSFTHTHTHTLDLLFMSWLWPFLFKSHLLEIV